MQRIDEIDQQFKGTNSDQDRLGLARERREVCREFARLLRSVETDFDQAVYFSDDGRVVRVSIHIGGVPAKKARDRATDWLTQRGVKWDGGAPCLRHAVREAMEEGEHFPADIFGLTFEWTISIAGPSKVFLQAKIGHEALLDLFEKEAET